MLNADVRREFALEFITQPRADLDLVKPRPDAEQGDILRRQVRFDARLEDQTLGDALVHLGLDPRGDVPAMRDEQCRVQLEHIGRKALHADHGMNASTFSARVTVATLSDLYSSITSAIGTLKGPLHGGANEGVIHMLQEIGSLDAVDAYIEDALANEKKIMGIGHRVYKVLDPRAPFLRKMAIKLTKELGESKWIDMSERIAHLMKERKDLNANVDFYSATVYYSLGIPTDLFTPIFAIARAAGWTAQVLEQLDDNRLYRPLTLYTGPTTDQPIKPIGERV